MPSWKVHLFFDSLLLLIFFRLFPTINQNFLLSIQLVILSYLLSLLPDIDSRKSKIRTFLAFISAFLISSYLFIFSFDLIQSIFFFICIFIFLKLFPTKHRGFTHSIEFSILVAFFTTFSLWLIFDLNFFQLYVSFIFLFSSYSSHLFLDSLSRI